MGLTRLLANGHKEEATVRILKKNMAREVEPTELLLELCEGTLWPKHKAQWQSLAEAGGASRRAMDVGRRAVQGRALGDAPSSECPHHLILQQPADLTHGGLNSQSVGCGQTGQSWVPVFFRGWQWGPQAIIRP